ncbi:MAG: hemolysin family protein [Verrucomicrobium sp.]|nr:hemolysin family protein [Verrucomicrobium sp.]
MNAPVTDPHLVRDIALLFVLVAANAYFVATEFAIVRVRATQLRPLAKKGNWRARIAYRVTQNLDRFISAGQLGVTFTSLGLGWVGEGMAEPLVDAYFPHLGPGHEKLLAFISFLVAFGITAALHIVLGELVPKRIALQRPRTVILWFTPPLVLFYYVFMPFIWVLRTSANLILRILGTTPSRDEHGFTPEELRDVLLTSTHEHPSDVLINQIMIKALRLKETTAAQIMVPRDHVITLRADATFQENLAVVQRSGYSRFPVCAADGVHVVGVVLVAELLWQYQALGTQTILDPLVRPVLTFLPKTKLPTMLELFRKSRSHLAVVVDGEDRLVGLVSFEDVLEELVGDIRDEFDIEKGPFYELSENAVLVDAGIPIRDLANETGWTALPTESAQTVREWAIDRYGRPPAKREQVDVDGLRLIAEDVGGQGLRRLRLLRLEGGQGAAPDEAGMI